MFVYLCICVWAYVRACFCVNLYQYSSKIALIRTPKVVFCIPYYSGFNSNHLNNLRLMYRALVAN